jgi:hypothetical protein
MANYIYIQTTDSDSNPIWQAGFYDPTGAYQIESTHDNAEAAAKRVHFLNGGTLAHAVQHNFQAQAPRKSNIRTHQT